MVCYICKIFNSNDIIKGKKTLSETLNQLFKPPHTIHLPKDTTKEDFLVKICGLTEYLYTDVPLESLQYIRESLRKNHSIDLALVIRSPDIHAKLQLYEEKCKSVVPNIFNFISNEEDTSIKNSISHLSIVDNFEVRIIYIQNIPFNAPALNNDTNFTIYAEGGLYFGGKLLSPLARSSICNVEAGKNTQSNTISFECDLPIRTNLEVWQIPRGSRLCITLYAARIKNKNMTFKKEDLGMALGWVSINLVNFKGHFASGRVYKRLWPNEKANPLGTCVDNIKTPNPIIATVEFTTFMKHHPSLITYTPLVHPGEEVSINKYCIPDPPGREDLLLLNRLVGQDPLYQLSEDEKLLLWENRFFLTNKTKALAKVLLSIDYNDPKLVADAIRTLALWVKLPPHDALELLDSQYSCPEIREHGVKCLQAVSDADLRNYLLQLVQALKYEPYHDSPLAKFLLSRAIHQRSTIGQFFFWHLKSEMHVPEISERYALILETYLRGCGQDCVEELLKQQELVMSLHQIAKDVFQSATTTSKRKDLLKKHLFSLDLPSNIINPLNPSIAVKNLIIDDCKVMDSAKAPLWLVFENADDLGKPIRIMFKSGDDLRQDMLTLQMFRIMDKLWKKVGMDLGMTAYMCLSTGDMQGMLEIVPNSRTIASIQKALGVNGVFKETGLMDWLMQGAWNGSSSSSNTSNPHLSSMSVSSASGQFVALGIAGIYIKIDIWY
jgi:phosphatidylinositol-4,5-bisphosphate 3-kinase